MRLFLAHQPCRLLPHLLDLLVYDFGALEVFPFDSLLLLLLQGEQCSSHGLQPVNLFLELLSLVKLLILDCDLLSHLQLFEPIKSGHIDFVFYLRLLSVEISWLSIESNANDADLVE